MSTLSGSAGDAVLSTQLASAPAWQTGKRGGYRVIYAVDTAGHRCILLFLYAKNGQRDVIPAEIEKLLSDLDL